MTPSARVPSRSCCAPARPRRASKCALICAGSCAISVNAGRGRASHSEAMATTPDPRRWTWCEDNDVDYVFGLPGSKPLAKKIDEAAEAVRTERAVSNKPVVRGYAETRHKAKSWNRERRAVARIEATPLGLDTRFVVTNVEYGAAEWVYDTLYCARGQAENLIKLHKTQLASDRTSCRSASATRSASFCTQRPIGSCSPFATPSPNRAISPTPSSRPCAAADQDRSPRHRNRKPRPSRFRRGLPGGRSVPRPARRPLSPRSLNDGEKSPSARRHPSNAFANVPVVRR